MSPVRTVTSIRERQDGEHRRERDDQPRVTHDLHHAGQDGMADRRGHAGQAVQHYDAGYRAVVSTWLNGGVAPTQVAEWTGQSVDVLLRIYATCLDGGELTALRRIDDALGS